MERGVRGTPERQAQRTSPPAVKTRPEGEGEEGLDVPKHLLGGPPLWVPPPPREATLQHPTPFLAKREGGLGGGLSGWKQWGV